MKYIPLDGNKLIKYLRNDSGIGIFVYNKDLQILEWCDVMKSYTGLAKEDCVKKLLSEVIPFKEPAPDSALFKSVLQKGACLIEGVVLAEELNPQKQRQYDFHLFALEEIDQQVENVLALVIPAEYAKIKKSNSLFRSAITNINNFLKYAPIPVFIVDTGLNLKLANNAFYVFTGRSPQKSENLRSFVPPVVLERLQRHIHTVVRTGHPLSISEYYELPKGPKLLYNVIFPVQNRHGEVDSIGGYLIDMTRQANQEKENEVLLKETLRLNEELTTKNQALELKKKELDEANNHLCEQKNALEKVVEELSDRNYELDQIMYKTSHDLRAPLTSILGLLQLAELEEDPSKLAEYHQYIRSRVSKLDDFVKTMLTLAKSSRTDISLQPVDWQQLVSGSLEQVQYMEHFSKIKFDISFNTDFYVFQSDAMRINIILNNLIANSVKYADLRKPESFIKVRINNTARGASIEVEDNGIGIPQDYINKVCEMFFRATDHSEGSGLGLYIVKQTVERLSGQLLIESKERIATTVSVFLPHLTKEQNLKVARPKTHTKKKKI